MGKKALEFYMAQDYPIEIRRIPERLGGGCAASIPYLGRMAFFAEGDTMVEALDRLQGVKKALFEDMIEHGKEIPLPPPSPEEEEEVYSGRILLRIPRELHLRLVKRAEANKCSINQYIATALAGQVEGQNCAEVVVTKMCERFSGIGFVEAQNFGQGYKLIQPFEKRVPLLGIYGDPQGKAA